MKTIWKFQIPFVDEFTLSMPQHAELLFVAAQNEQGCLWARVTPEHEQEDRKFLLRGTGHPIPADCKHIGSFIVHDDALVFHLFEPQS